MQIEHARLVGVERYLVIAEDSRSYDVLSKDLFLGLRGKLLLADRINSSGNPLRESAETFEYHSKEFETHSFPATHLKIQHARGTPAGIHCDASRGFLFCVFVSIHLKAGLDVLYCDVDTVWLQNPLSFLTDARPTGLLPLFCSPFISQFSFKVILRMRAAFPLTCFALDLCSSAPFPEVLS